MDKREPVAWPEHLVEYAEEVCLNAQLNEIIRVPEETFAMWVKALRKTDRIDVMIAVDVDVRPPFLEEPDYIFGYKLRSN